MGRRLLRALAVVALIGVVGGAIGPVRRAALRGAGLMLVAGDEAGPADVLVMDVESGGAGVLAISDLHRSQPRATVGILVPAGTGVDRELHRRGIVLPNLTLEMFAQLGIPKEAIIRIPAGEGGTTETTAAIGEWGRRNPGKRVLVVVGPSHGRRFRRALRRVWPDDRQPAPIVVTTPYSMFRADSWWQSRTTLREGLVELEKLALDYARHPWN